jgi:hypothetical protein
MDGQKSSRVPLPRWIPLVLLFTAAALVPWTLWLTFKLPSRHVTEHYDVAWVVFDCALFCAVAATAWSAVKESQWLVPFAAVTGTMLVCDAWFDVMTSIGSGDALEAILEAVFAELPLAFLCAFIVYDVERFLQTALRRSRS